MSAVELEKLGDLVSAIGSRGFGGVFYGLFRDILDFEDCTAFSFSPAARPQPIVIQGSSEARRIVVEQLAADYVSGGYLSDPNVKRRRPDVSVYAVESGRIRDAGYREHYYDAPAVAHELVVLGAAADTRYYISLYRVQQSVKFQQREIDEISRLSGFLIKALHRHRELAGPVLGNALTPSALESGGACARTFAHLREVLLADPHGLSPREAEVCAGIILGYSTLAISLNCSISPNTVATHRKRAYAKLGISSQNQLFARYFSAVRDFQGGALAFA